MDEQPAENLPPPEPPAETLPETLAETLAEAPAEPPAGKHQENADFIQKVP